MNKFGILGILLSLIGSIVGVVAYRKNKARRTTKQNKQLWLIDGITFDSYYVARAYAKDHNLNTLDIIVLESENN